MRGLRIFVFIALLSFACGIGWGWKVRRDRAAMSEQDLATVKTVRVLALSSIVPQKSLADFQTSHPVKVELDVAATPAELLTKWAEAKAAKRDPDLVTLLYSQVPDASRALKLQPLDSKRLPHFVWISRDFVDWPRSNEWPTTAPLVWGFDGWAQKKAPEGKKTLWVVTLAMTSSASALDEVYTVADWLLTMESAVVRTKEAKFATTSLEAENSDLEEETKASRLRNIPLTDYVLDSIETPEIKEPESE